MRGIKKETSRPRNRNQYQYVRSIHPGCWDSCPTTTQGGEWLSLKIPEAALWTSSTRTASCCHPRWIVCPSEPYLEEQKLRNRRERGMDCMEGDREPLTWISARVRWLCWPYETLHFRGAEWPHGRRNDSLLHTQRYCHQFAHSRLLLVSFWTPLDRFFF